MIKYFKIYFFIAFLFFFSVKAEECFNQSQLKIGLIENEFIDYKHYLYYELGKYASKKGIEFEINIVNNNPNEFDIIFGEHNELLKLNQNKINYPLDIEKFYKNNSIDILYNTFPLDLDTFLIVSRKDTKKINTIEEFSIYYDPLKYTMGMSLKSPFIFSKFISYNIDNNNYNFQEVYSESLLIHLKKIYKNLNKNILYSDFLEIMSSYENDENIFTLFSDGVLLNKNFNYKYFQLFPQSRYQWDKKDGIFNKRQNMTPYSYFGFSAYINNTKNIDFLCYLIKEDVRLDSFKKFNIQLSPLSDNEVSSISKNLPNKYIEILKKKKNYIMEDKITFNKSFYLDLIGNIIEEENLEKESDDFYLNN